MGAPAVGTVVDGMVFKGGNYRDPSAWGPVGSGGPSPFAKEDFKRVNAAQGDANKSLGLAQDAEEFLKLNQKSGTGGLRALGAPSWLGGGTVGDIAAMFDPNIGAMEAITSRVAPTFRVPGSGSSSDLDVKMFKKSFPNISNLGTANEKIGKGLQNSSDKKAALAAFYRTWFEKRGNLEGADQAFQSFWSKRQGDQLKARSPSVQGKVQADAPAQGDIVIDVLTGKPVK